MFPGDHVQDFITTAVYFPGTLTLSLTVAPKITPRCNGRAQPFILPSLLRIRNVDEAQQRQFLCFPLSAGRR